MNNTKTLLKGISIVVAAIPLTTVALVVGWFVININIMVAVFDDVRSVFNDKPTSFIDRL